jgi:hypothetical protein
MPGVSAGLRVHAILPEDFKPNIVLAKIRNQQRQQVKEVKAAAVAITAPWKHKVEWKSWEKETATHQDFMVWTTDKVFGYLDHGTKRHFIKPKKKKALHWVQAGIGYFSKGHWVSGIKKREYMLNIRKKFMDQYRKNMQNAIEEGFRVQGYRPGPGRIGAR